MNPLKAALRVLLQAASARRPQPLYPIDQHLSWIDEAIYRSKYALPYVCNVCGDLTWTKLEPKELAQPAIELRENLRCQNCNASNRNRQMATLVCRRLGVRSLADVKTKRPDCAIYNTEAAWAIHDVLKGSPGYVCSEYLGDHPSGTIVDGVMHQDLMRTSFPDARFDVVLTSDVLEHVPEPLAAFREIHRVLKPGGSHVFTVPFYQDRALNEARSRMTETGEIVHLKDPWYHVDPLRPEGALVYNVFSMELLAELERLGFETALYKLHDVAHGIIGQNALVLESVKRSAASG